MTIRKLCLVCGSSFVGKARQKSCSLSCRAKYVGARIRERTTDLERFERSFVRRSSGCWEWTKGRARRGYGKFWFKGKTRAASRVAYEIYTGRDPGGLFVLHTCDNPPCVNPGHLFLGTCAENIADMVAKGRKPRGETVAEKLTWPLVEEIRAGTDSQRKAATRFGVSQPLISKIRRREIWRTNQGAYAMGTKLNPGKFDCASRALPDEPQFTLLARDSHAAPIVRQWALLRELAIERGDAPDEDREMVAEARELAEKMDRWRKGNWPARKTEVAA